jgi:hypothetical protein
MDENERWIIYRCPSCGATNMANKGNVRMPCMCDGPVETIDVVPASELRGAVRALREIANADPVDMALYPGWAARVAKAALDATSER